MTPTTDATDALLKAAEDRIQEILLKLDEDLFNAGLTVDGIGVDTRRWGNMRCEILVRSRT